MAWPYHVDLTDVKDEILCYLQHHPEGSDTLEGVLTWWLLRQRLEAGSHWLSQALQELIDEGRICEDHFVDGTTHYQAGPALRQP